MVKKSRSKKQEEESAAVTTTRELFNPLVVIPSPRNMRKVREAINTLPFDRLWIKHYPGHVAYPLANDEFKKHKEYTHFILIPDDLVVPYESLKILIDDLLDDNMPAELKDNCVVAGYCSIDQTIRKEVSNVSFIIPPVERGYGEGRSYADYRFLSIEGVKNLGNEYFTEFNPHLFQTKFNGTTAWIIPRKVKDRFTFRNDSPNGKEDWGCCWDIMACYDLDKLGIPIFTDRRVELEHLRGTPEASSTFILQQSMSEFYYENPKGEVIWNNRTQEGGGGINKNGVTKPERLQSARVLGV